MLTTYSVQVDQCTSVIIRGTVHNPATGDCSVQYLEILDNNKGGQTLGLTLSTIAQLTYHHSREVKQHNITILLFRCWKVSHHLGLCLFAGELVL